MTSYRTDTIAPTESAKDYADHLAEREAELTERFDTERELPIERQLAVKRYLARRR